MTDFMLRTERPRAKGKFIFVGGEKFYVRGVTYGAFRPDENGNEYHTPEVVERDFAQMKAVGLIAVRTYTVPPRWLLDAAQRHGLRVMVGLPWEQHVAFLDFIGSLRRECLDHIIVFNEPSLRRILKTYFDYYEHSRTHLALEKDAPESRAIQLPDVGVVVELAQVGGLHHRYERRAA